MTEKKFPANIPEKSKAFFNRIKEDWEAMNPLEKAGIVAVAIITSPVIAGLAADMVGRYEFKKKHDLDKVI